MSRKWYIVGVVAIALCSVPGKATNNMFELSARLSGNHAFPSSLPNDYSSTSGLGWSVGVGSQLGLGNLIALAPELYFEKRTFDVSSPTTTNTISMQTICLPVMLRIGLPLGFMAEVGPEYVHFLSKPDGVSTDGEGLAALGLVWRAPFGLSIGARYQRGLTTISTPLDNDVQTNMTCLYVTYSLFEVL